jgi:uncharacterized protein
VLIKNLYFCIHFFGIVGWKAKYDIEFKGLKEGLHDYEFEADRKFFEHFDEGLVPNGEVKIAVELEKRSAFLKLNFEFSGWVELTCDRCLESYEQEIELETELFVKFGEETGFEEGDNVIWVLPEEHVINLAQVIYEYTVLSIPMKHIHPNKKGENSCDPEMLKKLKQYMHAEPEEKSNDEDIDPRWAALKNLKNNN